MKDICAEYSYVAYIFIRSTVVRVILLMSGCHKGVLQNRKMFVVHNFIVV